MTITVTDIRADSSASSVRAHRMPRRIPTPISQPPYDDERGDFGGRPQTNGSSALSPVARRVQPQPRLELVIDKPVSRRSVDDETLFGRQPTPTAALPDVRAWAGRLGRSIAEVLTGDRPAQQLMRWTNDAVFTDLCRRSEALAGAGTAHRGMRNRVSIISVHVCEPRDGVAEASVHVRHGLRSRAYALRLEGLDGRWRCTALQLG
jgi:hypothetical protein